MSRARLLSFALLAMLAVGVVTSLARADPPDPSPSTIPQHIVLVGRDALGNADPLGAATVVIRDLANNPIPGVDVLMDFSATPDMRPAAVQPDPAIVFVDCPGGPMLKATTGPNGSVTFRIVGQANRGAATATQLPSLRMSCQGVYLGTPLVSAYDLDGGGVGPSDLNAWLQDFFSGSYLARSDYDGNSIVGPNDLSLWLKAFFGSNSVQGGGTICP